MDSAEILIAGAGIIGLSTALELAVGGQRVLVLERGRLMSESSWAAAGMLAAGDPENPPAMRPLAQLSMRLYPKYLRTIEELSGLRVPLRTTGAIQATRLGHGFGPHADGVSLSRAGLLERVPGIVPGDHEYWLLEEPSLDPRDLCAALPIAVRAAGVTVLEDTLVEAAHCTSSGGVVVETSRGGFSASSFVNCCGAWSGQIVHSTDGGHDNSLDQPSIKPCKGQILAVELPHGSHLDYVLRTPEVYLVPRGDGRVVIGATVENAGFDKQVDAESIQWLTDQAAALWPPIAGARVIETWAGLRPATPDGLPVIGSLGADACGSKQLVASGHLRNGIMLAPGTARIMSQLIQGLPVELDIAAFDPQRLLPSFLSVHG